MRFRGGRGGIRTHGTLAGTAVFKTAALNHSATLPFAQRLAKGGSKGKRNAGALGSSPTVRGINQYVAPQCSHERGEAPSAKPRQEGLSLALFTGLYVDPHLSVIEVNAKTAQGTAWPSRRNLTSRQTERGAMMRAV